MIEDSIINIDRDKIEEFTQVLLSEFIKKQDPKIAEKIIKINIPIILFCLKRRGIHENHIAYDDFVSEGLLVVNKCINKYDPKKGRFFTYVFVSFNYKMFRLMQKYGYGYQIIIPQEVYGKLKKINNLLKIDKNAFLSKEEEELLKFNFKFISRDIENENFEDEDYSFDIQQYKEKAQDLEKKYYAEDCYNILVPTLKSLSNKEQAIINKCFGIKQKSETVFEISKDIGISRQRISLIKRATLKKLRIILNLKLEGLIK